MRIGLTPSVVAALCARVCVALVAQGCASTYITNDGADAAEAGARDHAVDHARHAKDAPVSDATDGPTPDGRPEAGACKAVSVGAVPSHGGPACLPDSGSCTPGDVTAFGPSLVPALSGAPHSGACTSSEVTELYDDCASSSGSDSACSTFKSTHGSCVACVLTSIAGSAFGPILYAGGFAEVNIGTCIALAEPCNQTCGYAILAELECQFQACNPASGGNCSSATPTADLACFAQALGCGCSPFAGIAEACTKELQAAPADHPAAALCLGGSNFQENFIRISDYFCAM